MTSCDEFRCMTFQLRSPAFGEGKAIPVNTRVMATMSHLHWSGLNPPPRTKSAEDPGRKGSSVSADQPQPAS